MTTIPLLSGATNVLKLKPNNNLIPSTVSDIDNLFNMSKLSDAKFNNWKSVASSSEKVGVVDVDTSVECLRYIDSNFNAETPVGSIWILGDAEQNHCYYLQTGAPLTKNNSSDVFSDQHHSFGFEATSGYIIDRCGEQNGGPQNDVTYQVDGVIGKSCRLGPANNSRFHFNNPSPYLGGQSNMTLLLLAKTPGDTTWFQWNNVRFQLSGGYPYLGFHENDATIYDISISNDEYLYLVGAWDGSLVGTNRIKLYIDKVLQTDVLFEVHTSDGETEESDVLKGDIGPIAAAPNNVEFDEFRIFNRTLGQDEIDLRYNQYTDSSYWTATVQPIISSVKYLGDNQWEINGTGFKPESTDPTVTINAEEAVIESAADDQVTISKNIGDYVDISIVLTNSDSETDSFILKLNRVKDDIMHIGIKI